MPAARTCLISSRNTRSLQLQIHSARLLMQAISGGRSTAAGSMPGCAIRSGKQEKTNYMKRNKFRSVVLVMVLFAVTAFAQSRLTEVKIKTSSVCKMCKETIEEYLSFEKGVKSVSVDLDSDMVKV